MLINSCLAAVISDLLELKIAPFFKYIDPKTKKKEEIRILCPTMSELTVRKQFKSPWIFYKHINCWFPILRGHKISIPFHLNFDFGHTVNFFLTDKQIEGQKLTYLVDLTGFQYDFFNTTKAGFPYFEEKVLSNENFNQNFIFQNAAMPIKQYK